MEISVFWIALIIGFIAGNTSAEFSEKRRCADEAIKAETAAWWKKALIHARARQDAKAVKE